MPSEDPSQPAEFQLPPQATAASYLQPPHPQPGVRGLVDVSQQMSSQAPTSAAQWKANRKQGFTVTLPSGMVAYVRRTFDMLSKLNDGKIPNPLAGLVQDMITNKRPNLDVNEMDNEVIEQMVKMFDETLEAMMISPRFQCRPEGAPWNWEPDDDAIGPTDVDLGDKVFLFQLAQGGTADLVTFRAQSEDLVASVPDVEPVPGPTE